MAKTAENQRVFSRLLKQQVEDIVKPKLVGILNNVASWLVEIIDGNFQPYEMGGGTDMFPFWLGHLHDATGVGVYVDGALTSYKPTSRGEHSQDDDATNTYNIIGSEYLENALQEASGEFANGIWIVLFSAVPYAYKVNTVGSPWNRGIGFFDNLEDTLKAEVFANLKPLGTPTT